MCLRIRELAWVVYWSKHRTVYSCLYQSSFWLNSENHYCNVNITVQHMCRDPRCIIVCRTSSSPADVTLMHYQLNEKKTIFQCNGSKLQKASSCHYYLGNTYFLFPSPGTRDSFLRFQLFQFKVLPFSISLAPQVFSRGMRAALCLLWWSVVSWYYHIWATGSKPTKEQAIPNVSTVFSYNMALEHREKPNTKTGHADQIWHEARFTGVTPSC